MIILSLFVGIPINGQWMCLYDFELISVPGMIFKYHTVGSFNIVIWCLLIISHAVIILMPFLKGKYFKSALIFAPLLFIVFYFVADFLTALLLIPFIITWLITLVILNRSNKLSVR